MRNSNIKFLIFPLVMLATLTTFLFYVLSAPDELYGYVKNIEGTAGIQGVNVSIYNATTGEFIGYNLTNSEGYYVFTGINPGLYNIKFTKYGYFEKNIYDFTVTGTTNLNATLYKDGYGSYTVKIIDYANNKPIQNAMVIISWGVGGTCPGPTCLVGITDENGILIKEVPGNESGGTNYIHRFNVSANGYFSNNSVTYSLNEGENVNVTIYLKGLCLVKGYIKDKYRVPGFEMISNGFVELLDYNNQSKLNFSNIYFYNTTSDVNGYYEIYYPPILNGTDSTCKAYVRSNVSYYKIFYGLRSSGVDYLLIELEGDSKINGSVYDYYANLPIINATINISDSLNDVVYTTYTDLNGVFNIWVRGNEAHKLKIFKTGYNSYINSTLYTGDKDYNRINLTGNAFIYGYVSDFQNESIELNNVNVTFIGLNENIIYFTTTDSAGYFSLNVSSYLNYNLTFSKIGYYTNNSLVYRTFSNTTSNNLGKIFLKGTRNVYGSVSDCSTNLQLVNNKINQTEISLVGDNENIYSTFTNSNGYYGLWIPSTISLYNITFRHTSYRDKKITQSESHDVCLEGKILLNGTVIDKYAVESKKYIKDAIVSVYGSDNKKYYEIYTNDSGSFTRYIGYLATSAYRVEINKSGFYGYNSGLITKSGDIENKDLGIIELIGKTIVNVSVYDDYDKKPISNAEIRIYLEEDGYLQHYYNGFTDSDGKFVVNINERSGTKRYKIMVLKSGYNTVMMGPYSSNANVTVYLYAATTVYVNDSNANTRYQKISGADVILYYNFDKNASYYINETIGYINTTCNYSIFSDLNVTINCTNCEYPYYLSGLTNENLYNGTLLARRIHIGNYSIKVNGSSKGCGVYTWNYEIYRNLSGKTFVTDNFNVGVTQAKIRAVIYNESIMNYTALGNVLITLSENENINCTTNSSNGICILNYVPSGINLTFKASHPNYYTNYTNYTIIPANTTNYINDFSLNPIILKPYSGNLSIKVIEKSGSPISNINVTLKNSTASISKNTDVDGFANFTDVSGFYNITVNGTKEGYGINITNYYFIIPNQTTVYEIYLQPTFIKIHVQANGINVSDANVTLLNITTNETAKNVSGDDLTAITGNDGNITFSRILSSIYNLTINATHKGYDFYFEEIQILPGENYKVVDLLDSQPPIYTICGSEPENTVNEGSNIKLYCRWQDNTKLDTAILYTNATGNWIITQTLKLTGSLNWSNFTFPTSNLGGKYIKWSISMNDSSNNINQTENKTFYVIPLFTVNLVSPTPNNATKISDKWVFVNASISKSDVDTCILRWKRNEDANFVNYTMNKVGNTCYYNISLFNGNYTYYVYANLTSGEGNNSETRLVEVFGKIPLLVIVNDDQGNYVKLNATNNGALVRIWNSTYYTENETNNYGNVTFFIWPGTYNVSVNGTNQGYGVNETYNNFFNDTQNTTSLIVNITTLNVYVTNSTGHAQPNILVTVYKSDNLTIAKNATGGNLTGYTLSNGIITFKRVLPCNNCNITVGAGATKNSNSTRFNLSAGENLTVNIDPPAPNSGVEFIEALINVSSPDIDNEELDNITIIIYNSTHQYSNKTVDGVAIISIPSGYWNITIDGSAVGFGIFNDFNVGLGKVVVNSGVTNTDGYVSLQIAGDKKYYLRVEKPGYYKYDDIENGTERIGQQSIYVNLQGQSTVKGLVFDNYFYGIEKEKVDNATVNLYMATDCNQLSENNLRYSLNTNTEGNYIINVSNKQMVENLTQSYCIKVIANGYKEKLLGPYYFDEGNNEINISLIGDSYISGYVKDIITDFPISYVDVKIYTGGIPSRLAYTTTTDENGYFSRNVSSREKYLNYTINFSRVDYYSFGENIPILPNVKNYYMRPGGTTIIGVNVSSSENEDLTNASEILWNVSSTRYKLDMQKPYCINLFNNTINCWVYNQIGYLIVNGTFLGYGINVSYVENPNQTFNIHLNKTILNITIKSDENELVDNMTITLQGSFYQNVTKNGSAIFVRIPIGKYNISFSGNGSDVYYYNGSNKGVFEVSEDMSGKLNEIEYILNETRALVTIKNETNEPIPTINVTLINLTLGIYQNQTDQNGNVLIRKIKPGNYTILLNTTQLYSKGYVPINSSIYVTPGEDENTKNNITILIEDINITLKIINTTGNAIDANVSVYLNNSMATNGYDEALNGSLSNGIITFSNVKPSENYLNENYTVIIDANKTGYGIRRVPIFVSLNSTKNYLEINLTSMSISVNVFNESEGNVENNVTLKIIKNGELQYNGFGEPQEKNITSNQNSTQFTHLLVLGEYNLSATSIYYFNSSYPFNVTNDSVNPSNITFLLIPRKLYVFVNSNGNILEEGVNISIINATDGSSVIGTNGSIIQPKINVINYTVFEFIPDGEFNITINSSLYFKPADFRFSTKNITDSNLRNVNFSLSKREIKIILRDENNSILQEEVNVSIINKTNGAIINGLNNQPLTVNKIKDNVTLTHIPDGEFYINIKSNIYFSRNISFDTSEIRGGNNTLLIRLYRRNVNIQLYDLSSQNLITENMTVEFLNSNGQLVLNLSGVPLNKTTLTGQVIFYGIPDGNYYINSSGENYTSLTQYNFNSNNYDGSNINILHLRKGFGYFNISITSTQGETVQNAFAEVYYNDTEVIGSGYTNQQGFVIIPVNISRYYNLLKVKVYTYYGSSFFNVSGPYNLNEKEVKNIPFIMELCGDGRKNGNEECDNSDFGGLSCSNFGYNSGRLSCSSQCKITIENCYNIAGGGGGTIFTPSPTGMFVGKCTEDWVCYEWNECQQNGIQTRTCIDRNSCNTTKSKPETTKTCIYKASLDARFEKISIKAGECKNLKIEILNNGTVSLKNIIVSGKADCCSISSMSLVSIQPGIRSSGDIKVCANKGEKRGTKNINIFIKSDKVEKEFVTQIDIEKEYTEVILDELDKLSEKIEIIKQDMSIIDYLKINSELNNIKDLVANGEIERAESSLQNLIEIIEKREYEKTLWLNYIIFTFILAAFISTIGLFYRKRSKNKKLKEHKAIIEKDIELIKERISEIEKGRMSEQKRIYCEEIKRILEETENSIKKGKINEAKKYIDDALVLMSKLEELNKLQNQNYQTYNYPKQSF